jgi:hypothetical protein
VIRLEGVVTFGDGRQEAVSVRQAEYAAWELYALRHGLSSNPEQAPAMMMTRYLAFAAIQRRELRPPKDWDDFDDWAVLVDDVELDADSLEEAQQRAGMVPPTLQDRSAG